MGKKTVSYRGNLKSCNYRCSYCPFSKHKALTAELEKDRQDFRRFCDSIERRAAEFSIGAVLIAPYGEASLHRWYWEGLGRLSGIPEIDRVGLQTNLSFSVEECLEIFDLSGAASKGSHAYDGAGYGSDVRGGAARETAGGRREKLCIWATFHPEMTDADVFAAKCRKLAGSGVRLCAGAVGVPGNIPLLHRLREALPADLYLWINKMDGLGRNYTAEERAAFSEIDPFFEAEFKNPAADAAMCADRCFVEADGRIRTCNIGRMKDANWYQGQEEDIFRPVCGKKRCSCYLAYGGRADFEKRWFFGKYPIFRIPEKWKAVFLDLDGTLIPEGASTGLSDRTRKSVTALGKMCPVFLATSMPKEEAERRLKGDMDLFEGAVFASGAYVRLWGRTGGEERKGAEGAPAARERVHPLNAGPLSELEGLAGRIKAQMRVYQRNHVVYKITLFKKRGCGWKEQERQNAADLLKRWDCRMFVENHCMEIVGRDLDKGTGICEICQWLGIRPEETMAMGNDREDEAMDRVCGASFLSEEGLI